MGLFGFGKKKTLDLPTSPKLGDLELDADLPPLNTNDLASLSTGNSDNVSVGNLSSTSSQPKSISFNAPTLDFSLPPMDGEPGITSQGTPRTGENALTEGLPELSLDVQPKNDEVDIDAEMNKLFLNDPEWKEPDWNTFDPYYEDKIEEPKPEDFSSSGLPQFDDASTNSQMITTFSDEPVLEPKDPYADAVKPEVKPLELFIRGKAYNRVFVELDQMNKTLSKIDSQVSSYEDMLKREEPLLITAKDQMEYLYKRLNQLDKKIFIQ